MVRISLHQLVPIGLSSNVDRSNRGGGRRHIDDCALCKTRLNLSVPTVVVTPVACSTADNYRENKTGHTFE